MPNYALVVTCGGLQYTRLCLGDLLGQDVPMSIYVVVNEPDDPVVTEPDRTAAYLQSVCEALRHDTHGRRLEFITTGTNLGCGPSWNLGLRHLYAQGAESVLVCGNDARLRPDTYRVLNADPRGAVFSAWTPTLEDMHAGVVGNPHLPKLQWNEIPDVGPVHIMRKEFFEAVGGYDPKFVPVYWEDVDFYHRAALLGLAEQSGCVKLPSFHSDGGSRTVNRSAAVTERHHKRFLRCKARYVAKWGGEPGHETFTVPFNGAPDPDGDWMADFYAGRSAF